jgi:hypothetical protein
VGDFTLGDISSAGARVAAPKEEPTVATTPAAITLFPNPVHDRCTLVCYAKGESNDVATTNTIAPDHAVPMVFGTGNRSEVRLVVSNNGGTPAQSAIEISRVELFELGETPYQWTRYPRAAIRGLQKNLFKTNTMLPLVIAGLLLLGPVLDFSVKTAAEVYADTLPPKVKAAIKSHDVLVGMNRDMVIMAKERTQQKMREKDEKGEEYEEWLYGTPPADVVFVRFKGDEVIQVKTIKINGQMIVKTEKEVDVKDGVTTLAALKASESPEDLKNQPPPPNSGQCYTRENSMR